MLEHQMIVLSNVSTDKDLFKKELMKSMKWLDPIEFSLLMDWVGKKYGHQQDDVINEIFADTAA